MAVLKMVSPTGWSDQNESNAFHNNVSTVKDVDLDEFSKMAGFPSQFVKKELMVSEEKISLNELREKVLSYLDQEASELESSL